MLRLTLKFISAADFEKLVRFSQLAFWMTSQNKSFSDIRKNCTWHNYQYNFHGFDISASFYWLSISFSDVNISWIFKIHFIKTKHHKINCHDDFFFSFVTHYHTCNTKPIRPSQTAPSLLRPEPLIWQSLGFIFIEVAYLRSGLCLQQNRKPHAEHLEHNCTAKQDEGAPDTIGFIVILHSSRSRLWTIWWWNWFYSDW